MKRSTLVKAAYEIRLALCDLGKAFGIHPGTPVLRDPLPAQVQLYNQVEKHISDGIKILSHDVTEEDDKDAFLKRIHGQTPVERLKTYLGQQKALLNDFIEHQKPEGEELLQARAHIATYDDCLQAVTNILEEVPA